MCSEFAGVHHSYYLHVERKSFGKLTNLLFLLLAKFSVIVIDIYRRGYFQGPRNVQKCFPIYL